MDPKLELLDERPKDGGVAVAAIASVVLHLLLLLAGYLRLVQMERARAAAPVPQIVEFIPRVPTISSYVEAPGNALPAPPANPSAPLSNANRRAASPEPTGEKRVSAPGTGGIYTPGGAPQQPPQRESGREAVQAAETPVAAASAMSALPTPAQPARETAAQPGVDWRGAIREVGKFASLGDARNVGTSGGDKGFAESGPISFESQWFDWGDYADSMVRKIRVNWYDNMPPIIRMGVKGVVTIRFTIQRNGQITDITTLSSSDVPPFDFAARKAIEISSPLAPLPSNFPNATERVTATFYYNLNPPQRGR